MNEIEWESESVLQPEQRSLAEFCVGRGLLPPAASDLLPLVFVSTKALDDLLAFLGSDTGREHGGVLAGLPYIDEALGITFVDVEAAIPALDTEGSPVHLQFTAPAWDFMAGLLADEYPGRVVVGWFHSHPGLGIFMSATDSATQRAFYNRPWHLALVVDPLARRSGWFCGPDCAPLGQNQLMLYAGPGARRVAKAAGEAPASTGPQQPVQDWRWLLPLAAFFLAGVVAGWIWMGNRLA
jgi:proteasome lid subunit RPN8/RPN11